VHEIGHTQGRYHVDCGGAGGPDPNYPYAGGNTETWGYANEAFTTLPPSYKDYMSYCGPTWVSDYGWDLVFPRIELISSWDLEGNPPPENGRVLVGMLDPDGKETWFVVDGSVGADEVTTGESMRLTTDGAVHDLPAVVYRRGDADGVTVAVQLPPTLSDLTKLTAARRTTRVGTLPVDLEAVRAAGR
jgi:hypothetical protein